MSRRNDTRADVVCRKLGHRTHGGSKPRWLAWVFPCAGVATLLWFLIRVIPQNYATILQCTIVGNRACGVRGGAPLVVNSILYANSNDGKSAQIQADAPTVEYCDVQGGCAGTSCINADPASSSPATGPTR